MSALHDACARPPTKLRDVYKEYQKLRPAELDGYPGLLDTRDMQTAVDSGRVLQQHLQLPRHLRLRTVFADFLGRSDAAVSSPDLSPVYEVQDMPGLLIYPSLLPSDVQRSLLEKFLHRDVSNPQHQTNVHLFHHVLYPPPDDQGNASSFFESSASNITFQPKHPNVHKPFSTKQFLNKKLRWATLGGQYDWTNKIYPNQTPPAFPSDTKKLVEDLFPMKAEAAILNIYSPGDTLSLHRDVSEECDQPLVSISIGCDAVFITGLDSEDCTTPKSCCIRLRSGDAVLMKAASRYAWHGVPKVIEGSCPKSLREWPAELNDDAKYEQWRGWMKTKRVNLNVRQMFD
ncbi:hypothetical protein AC579_6370 [Pseudocercospora musae]|uniref:mRNA N(6)-methyladenine demethylase n=1 Tax=Pseudocercospora musae TaxID=113226 RepID=A0A139IJ03_9PEZI|nr:hypothetical protein AC579_6370 [Pseudocercospora musae]KXT14689.1 hypothetical protein AC579_6370 [Pseudocercospora musae]KXT14690.1 hypothetical protein AC579_6370 [Pseudocercospora musae]